MSANTTNTPTRTELATLGEFGLIERLANGVQIHHPQTIKGIGDDAAVVKISDTESMVITTDLLAEGIHFDLAYVPLKHLGYKAVAVNLSDVAAMNAVPRQITVSIALSNRFSVEAIDELYAGINSACEAYKVDLVGGDTTSSRAGLIISVTAIGVAKTDKIVYRSGAKPGQVVCVSGDLGAAYLGLQILEREKREFVENPDMKPKLEGNDYLIGRQLKPEARMDVIYDLAEQGVVPTAMIDVSDGLASEVLHLSRQSGVGFAIYEDTIPLDNQAALAASDFGLVGTTCALNGGEDYELLMTFTQEDFEKVRKTMASLTAIGITRDLDKGNYLHTRGGQQAEIKAQGWTSF